MKITWIGHSCFKVESQGYQVILDPYGDGSVDGLLPVREEANLVLCSHEHGDHNARASVALKAAGACPFQIQKIETYHDDCGGAMRGPDIIHILSDGACRIAHLGDLGCTLQPEQMAALQGLDALLIPVGGYYTIDAKQAKTLADQLQARIVIPMHYRSGNAGYKVLGTVEEYTGLCDDVKVYTGSVIEIGADTEKQTAVLQAQNKEGK